MISRLVTVDQPSRRCQVGSKSTGIVGVPLGFLSTTASPFLKAAREQPRDDGMALVCSLDCDDAMALRAVRSKDGLV